ncbi:hypothetical protein [Paraburkholderia sp. C35]|uniref:hypothetical protein n=1 Tax=Paraburkholderia sp. C35 TaxID=2126993 RepID=UPI00194DD144|nr:hypothetical protein [Paraburkholderia sp. C35]
MIVERIAIGLAFERDASLPAALGIIEPGIDSLKQHSIVLGENGPAILVNQLGACEAVVDRPAASGRYKEYLADDGVLKEKLWQSCQKTGSLRDAQALMREMLAESINLPRETIGKLQRWKSLFATNAYTWVTLAGMLLDSKRESLKKQIKAGGIRQRFVIKEYASLVHSMGAFMCLACAGSDNRWLEVMAEQVPWGNWTPSLVLSRERSLLSTLQGATVASAFGVVAIDRYLDRLVSVGTPFGVFDCVIGLVSLARQHTNFAGNILNGIYKGLRFRERRLDEDAQILRALWKSARIALEEPECGERFLLDWAKGFGNIDFAQTSDRPGDGFLSAVRSDIDGAQMVGEYFPAILAVPLFSNEQPGAFYLPQALQSVERSGDGFKLSKQFVIRSATTDISINERKFH